ncbi:MULTISPECIES: DeoR family transcriptional regulator [Enterobacterales]|nr:DeoR family transcriptional regulator [Hafnia paralvei]QLU89226.1 DeoR family transcriptional regulator [Enterobacter hormaechei]QMR45003.1 DeoR family transcriptional regulator [Citrobacter freundii]HCJ6306176.1 DeoR family transcriptional regulator [Enterobacter hormaechei subsp. xiangfangensis]HED3661211.1 DeoR family transcriptional regulator [Enterobacter hormaechei subsp. hoffmannii]
MGGLMARAEKLAERLCHCVILLCQGKTLSVRVLTQLFGVSPRTARRDLARMGCIMEPASPGCWRLSAPLRRAFIHH